MINTLIRFDYLTQGVAMFLWFPKLGQCVAEPQIVLAGNSRWTERHIQCIWYDSSLRPKILRTDSGEEFTIINPGTWNLEEGSDFLGAEIRFIKSGKVIRGDVELHVRPSDWVAHHHSGDENYSNLVMHVCWFGGYNSAPLPPHVHNVTLKEQILIQQNFSFEQIAITAYPHAILNETPPCGQYVANLPKEQLYKLLLTSGESRLRRKSADMAARYGEVGDIRQLFQEEFFAALGYKNNKEQFRLVARLVSHQDLSIIYDPKERFAMLLANAGLLKSYEGTAVYRELWDMAWQLGCADALEAFPLKWKRNAIRPQNKPENRLALAACLFGGKNRLFDDILTLPRKTPNVWWRSLKKLLKDYLKEAELFGIRPSLGTARIASIAINVIIPILTIQDPDCVQLAGALPGEADNSIIRETAFRLLGRDHNPAIYSNSAIYQQGLIEIWYRFCLTARVGCSNCILAKSIKEGKI